MPDHSQMSLRSENEILFSWKAQDLPLVSIVCHTFQHGSYIKQTINSFLVQRTDFPIEIIIHDDASSDNTRSIIEDYQKKYPRIIFPILQTKNQYSQNKKPSFFTFKAARGKYIALCEGDDYWIDVNKLAKQVMVFKENNDVSLCFHPAEITDQITDTTGITCNHFSCDKKVPLQEVILGRGHFMPTASLMFVNKNIGALIESFKGAPVGDYFTQVYMSSLKGAYYINTPMSAYRKNTPTSWSANKHLDAKAQIKHKTSMIRPIAHLSAHLNMPAYNKYFEEVIAIYFVAATGLSQGGKNTINLYIQLIRLILNLDTLDKTSIFFRISRRLIRKKFGAFKKLYKNET